VPGGRQVEPRARQVTGSVGSALAAATNGSAGPLDRWAVRWSATSRVLARYYPRSRSGSRRPTTRRRTTGSYLLGVASSVLEQARRAVRIAERSWTWRSAYW